MGKASDLTDDLVANPLTPDEIRKREAARAIADPRVYATLDGRLVKDTTPATAPREVQPARTDTWD